MKRLAVPMILLSLYLSAPQIVAQTVTGAIRGTITDPSGAIVSGATVTATVEVTSLNPEKKRATLKTTCTVGDEVVIEGEAYVQVPSRG